MLLFLTIHHLEDEATSLRVPNKYSNDKLQLLFVSKMDIYRVHDVTDIQLFVHPISESAAR